MSGKIIGGDSGRGQHSERRDGSGEDGRLRELRQPKLLIGPVKTESRQIEAKGIIRFGKGLLRDRESKGQVAAHADALRTLTRK
jgi:hypothetical protein